MTWSENVLAHRRVQRFGTLFSIVTGVLLWILGVPFVLWFNRWVGEQVGGQAKLLGFTPFEVLAGSLVLVVFLMLVVLVYLVRALESVGDELNKVSARLGLTVQYFRADDVDLYVKARELIEEYLIDDSETNKYVTIVNTFIPQIEDDDAQRGQGQKRVKKTPFERERDSYYRCIRNAAKEGKLKYTRFLQCPDHTTSNINDVIKKESLRKHIVDCLDLEIGKTNLWIPAVSAKSPSTFVLVGQRRLIWQQTEYDEKRRGAKMIGVFIIHDPAMDITPQFHTKVDLIAREEPRTLTVADFSSS
jgi:hypothetical protein